MAKTKKHSRFFILMLALCMAFSLAVPGIGSVKVSAEQTPEAVWGASADSLTESGTLKEAFYAVRAEGSSIGYIKLQGDVILDSTNADDYVLAPKGALTLDLNGHSINTAREIRLFTGYLEIDDTAGGGGITLTGTDTKAAVTASSSPDETITIVVKGGTLTGKCAVSGNGNGNNIYIYLEGGTLNGTQYGDVYSLSQGVTVVAKGSTLTSSVASFAYGSGGSIDLTHATGASYTINVLGSMVSQEMNVTNVIIPEGWALYDAADAKVTANAVSSGNIVTAKPDVNYVPPVKWGSSPDSLAGGGTLVQASEAGAEYIQLQDDVTLDNRLDLSNCTFDLNGHSVLAADGFTALSLIHTRNVVLKGTGTVGTGTDCSVEAYNDFEVSGESDITFGGLVKCGYGNHLLSAGNYPYGVSLGYMMMDSDTYVTVEGGTYAFFDMVKGESETVLDLSSLADGKYRITIPGYSHLKTVSLGTDIILPDGWKLYKADGSTTDTVEKDAPVTAKPAVKMIVGVEKVKSEGEADTYRITFDNNTFFDFTVTNGSDGQDGITPKLRINADTNEWEASYDNGATWTSLGIKATGDNGIQGEKGEKGDTGAVGSVGAKGEDGQDGKPGENGKDGSDGKNGLALVAFIIASVALIGNIALLVYIFYEKKRLSEK